MAENAPAAESLKARLLDLIDRASQAATRPSTNKRNAALFLEMSATIVALAQRITQLQAQQEEKPLIVAP